MRRKCSLCKQPGGVGPRELRPYGAGGADVCAGCVFGERGKKPSAKHLATAGKQLAKQLMTPEPLVIDAEEQVGPRPLRKRRA